MSPETRARLIIAGEFDPDVLTDRLGIAPDRTMRKGDSWWPPRPELLAENDAWYSNWCSGLSEANAFVVEDYISALIDEFWPRRDTIAELQAELELELEVAVSVRVYGPEFATPSVHLSQRTLRRIGALGADVDIDLYVFSVPPGGTP